jgi:hypothetical protein
MYINGSGTDYPLFFELLYLFLKGAFTLPAELPVYGQCTLIPYVIFLSVFNVNAGQR